MQRSVIRWALIAAIAISAICLGFLYIAHRQTAAIQTWVQDQLRSSQVIVLRAKSMPDYISREIRDVRQIQEMAALLRLTDSQKTSEHAMVAMAGTRAIFIEPSDSSRPWSLQLLSNRQSVININTGPWRGAYHCHHADEEMLVLCTGLLGHDFEIDLKYLQNEHKQAAGKQQIEPPDEHQATEERE